MPLTTNIAAYPAEMMEAIKRAHACGQVDIPTLTPSAMRLQFNGLRGALRAANQAELADMVEFRVKPNLFQIVLRASLPMFADIKSALGKTTEGENPIDDVEDSLARILGSSSLKV